MTPGAEASHNSRIRDIRRFGARDFRAIEPPYDEDGPDKHGVQGHATLRPPTRDNLITREARHANVTPGAEASHSSRIRNIRMFGARDFRTIEPPYDEDGPGKHGVQGHATLRPPTRDNLITREARHANVTPGAEASHSNRIRNIRMFGGRQLPELHDPLTAKRSPDSSLRDLGTRLLSLFSLARD